MAFSRPPRPKPQLKQQSKPKATGIPSDKVRKPGHREQENGNSARRRAKQLQRSVREEEVESSEESEYDSDLEPRAGELDVSSPEVLETGADEGGAVQSGESTDETRSEAEEDISSGEDENDALKRRLATVSFGALARARDELGTRKRKREDDEGEEKLRRLRERLRELREEKGAKSAKSAKDVVAKEKKVDGAREKSGKMTNSFFVADEGTEDDAKSEDASSPESEVFSASEDDNDEEAAPREKKSRTSKHAPAVQSSRRAVTRKRPIVTLPKSTLGDPRFERFTGRLNPASLAQKYAFLDSYRASELDSLRAALKNPATPPDDADKLKRKIRSLESQQRAKAEQEREKRILREHRKKEAEARREGKRPFYLKKSDVRKQALTERFEGMKAKERDRAIERRRKKIAAKERRRMPEARRS